MPKEIGTVILDFGIRVFEGTKISKIPGFSRIFYIWSKLFDIKIYGELEGMKIRAKISPRRILHYSDEYNPEPHIRAFFCSLIREGMIVVDVGAFIGYYTLLASKRVGNKGLVLSFEPEPSNFEILVENIRINGLVNVRPFRMAVGNRIGKMKFDIKGIDYIARTNLEGFTMDVISLDSLIQNADVVKIDVVGGVRSAQRDEEDFSQRESENNM